MTKQFKKVICFFAPAEICEQLNQAASNRDVSLSHLLRGLVRQFLRSQSGRESGDVQKKSLTDGTNVSDPSSGFQKSDEEKSQLGGKNHEQEIEATKWQNK